MVSLGGGGSKQKSRSRPVNLTEDAYRESSAATNAAMRRIYEPVGLTGVPNYEGPLTTPMTATEGSVLDSVVRKGTSNPFGIATDRLLTDTLAGRYVDPSSNPFYEAYIRSMQRPVRQAFDEATLGDRATFTNAGQNINESSPYARARAIADRGLADAFGDISTRFGTAMYDKERTLQAAAPEQAQAVQNAELDRQIKTLSAASLPRLIEEQGIERGLEIYKQRLAALQNILGLAVSASKPTPAQSTDSSASSWNASLGVLT